MNQPTKHGGARPKRRNTDQRGGARPGAGALQVRLRLPRDVAQELKILTLVRRGVTCDQTISPDNVASQIIHAAWMEYDAGVEEEGFDPIRDIEIYNAGVEEEGEDKTR